MMTSDGAGSEHRSIGLGGSVFAAVLWGFGGIFAALTYAPGMLLAFYRLWVGTLVLVVILYASHRRLSWAVFRATWVGGLLLAGDMAMFYCAVKTTSIVDVTVIGAFQPALVMIASRRLFSERVARWDILWIVVAMVGVSIAVVGPGARGEHKLTGDLLAVGSLVSFSAYWMVSKYSRERTGALEYTAGVTFFAALAMTFALMVSSQPLSQIRAGDWWWIGVLVAVPGSGHLVMNWAHRFIDASISSAISCLSPLIASMVAIPILGQRLTLVQITGVVVGLLAIAGIAVRQRQPLETPLE